MARAFEEIDDVLTPAAKAQLKCEIIMLTHNEGLHEVNMAWHPKAEQLLWRPDLQEPKWSQNGQKNLRYKVGWKRQWLDQLLSWKDALLPYCEVRYAF